MPNVTTDKVFLDSVPAWNENDVDSDGGSFCSADDVLDDDAIVFSTQTVAHDDYRNIYVQIKVIMKYESAKNVLNSTSVF